MKDWKIIATIVPNNKQEDIPIFVLLILTEDRLTKAITMLDFSPMSKPLNPDWVITWIWRKTYKFSAMSESYVQDGIRPVQTVGDLPTIFLILDSRILFFVKGNYQFVLLISSIIIVIKLFFMLLYCC